MLDAAVMQLGAIYALTHSRRLPSAKTRAWIDFLVARIPVLAKDW
ncbi:MAG: hypothetical protein PF501_17490 [Salinisphaera sp.]|nr:hypothetical protein [Salinisphaera sp.]